MPPVQVAECETAADVWRVARAAAMRRKTWNAAPPVIKLVPPTHIPSTSKGWIEEVLTWNEWIKTERVSEHTENGEAPRPLAADIIRATARAYGFRSTDLKAARRDIFACQARHVAMLLCKMLTLRSLVHIGNSLGGRDHTTVLYGVQKLAWLGAKLELLHTLADPPSEWAASAARLHPLPTMARAYVRREKMEGP